MALQMKVLYSLSQATLGSSGVKGSIQELRGRHKEEKEEVMDTQGSSMSVTLCG